MYKIAPMPRRAERLAAMTPRQRASLRVLCLSRQHAFAMDYDDLCLSGVFSALGIALASLALCACVSGVPLL